MYTRHDIKQAAVPPHCYASICLQGLRNVTKKASSLSLSLCHRTELSLTPYFYLNIFGSHHVQQYDQPDNIFLHFFLSNAVTVT
jgi:hypothetical protein